MTDETMTDGVREALAKLLDQLRARSGASGARPDIATIEYDSHGTDTVCYCYLEGDENPIYAAIPAAEMADRALWENVLRFTVGFSNAMRAA